jgi:hypothetical protein
MKHTVTESLEVYTRSTESQGDVFCLAFKKLENVVPFSVQEGFDGEPFAVEVRITQSTAKELVKIFTNYIFKGG